MANSPLVMVDQYVYNLQSLQVIGIEIGEQDERVNPATVRALDEKLTCFKVPHTFETYEGTHGNKIAERFEKKALPFFSKNLKGKN